MATEQEKKEVIHAHLRDDKFYEILVETLNKHKEHARIKSEGCPNKDFYSEAMTSIYARGQINQVDTLLDEFEKLRNEAIE